VPTSSSSQKFPPSHAPREQNPVESIDDPRLTWAQLALQRGTPMQQPDWAEAFVEAFAHIGAPRVLAAGPNGQPTAIATFVVRPGIASPLEALAVREIFEPWDMLAASSEAAAELAAKLAREGRAVYIPRIPADSATLAALREAYRRRGMVRVAQTDAYPTLALDESWHVPERKFNAGRRSDFRRARRHAEKHGKVHFEVLSPAPAELAALLEEAWQVEAKGWKGERGSALAHDTERGAFYRRVAFAAARTGTLRLAFMRIDGKAVAMQLAIEADGRLWLFKIGYDEAYAKCSPGQQLMMEVVRWAASRRLRAVEFLGQREPWTDQWTQQLTRCVSVRAYSFAPRAMLTLARDTLAFIRNRLRMKPWVSAGAATVPLGLYLIADS
jgi:CelD/BcsL family acetyltransferase involved in cellulose biosynthesis